MRGEICMNCWFVIHLLSDESKLPWSVTFDPYFEKAVVQLVCTNKKVAVCM